MLSPVGFQDIYQEACITDAQLVCGLYQSCISSSDIEMNGILLPLITS